MQTDFLPDKDREVEEEDLREKLKLEWNLRQRVWTLAAGPPSPASRPQIAGQELTLEGTLTGPSLDPDSGVMSGVSS